MATFGDSARFEILLGALGIPYLGTSFRNGKIAVTYAPTATAAQIAQGNSILSSWVYGTYQSRTLPDLYAALSALTAAQKSAIAADLFAGSLMKVLIDTGPNAAAIAVLYFLYQSLTLSSADKATAQLYAAAMYAQDNPAYLIAPAFDKTINVPGWAVS